MMIRILALAAALAIPTHAGAQSAVGKALVGGKVVTLFDDGTWKYADAAPAVPGSACDQVTPEVQFCAADLGWTTSPPGSAEINAAYRIDARHYAQFLIEGLGTDDGLSAEFMRQIVLQNAKAATGNEAEVIDVQTATLGGITGDTVVYKVKIDGVNVVFANSIFLKPKQAMQIMTYAIASDYSADHAGFQADLLANTKLAE